MTSADDINTWNTVAQRYAERVPGPANSFYRRLEPFLRHQFGDLHGRSVLDVGCGHGWLTHLLAQQGATAVGIDGSSVLLEQARSRYPGIGFIEHDLTRGLPRPLAVVDRIVAHLVLMDLPKLSELFADVASSLDDHGVFVFSILHPAFFGQEVVYDERGTDHHRAVRGYLTEETWWIEAFGGHRHYHRPLSTYVNLLAENGLAVTGMGEPLNLPDELKSVDQWTDRERWFATIPTMLGIAASRISKR